MSLFLSVLLTSWSMLTDNCQLERVRFAANRVPVEWAKGAMRQQGLCGILLAAQTHSTGNPDRYHRQGRRDVLAIIPATAKPTREVVVVYWFHGLTGYSQKMFRERLMPQVKWLVENRPERHILVVPEMPWSRFTRTQWKRQGRVFRRKGEFAAFVAEAEQLLEDALGHKPAFRRVVVGHSAGGSAIASAAKWGGLCDVRPEAVVFSDSTYSRWFDRAWKGCLGELSRTGRVVVLGQSFGSPWHNYIRWAKQNPKSSRRVEAHRLKLPWTHRRIGNNALKLFYGGTK